MAQSRYGSAGELLAWRPIVWDTRAIMPVPVAVGVNRGGVGTDAPASLRARLLLRPCLFLGWKPFFVIWEAVPEWSSS
jgi:hypothetical protein